MRRRGILYDSRVSVVVVYRPLFCLHALLSYYYCYFISTCVFFFFGRFCDVNGELVTMFFGQHYTMLLPSGQ